MRSSSNTPECGLEELAIHQALWLCLYRHADRSGTLVMLKITTTHDDGFVCVLKLEGRLMAAWVSELQKVCRTARAGSGHLQLDLSGLLFVDLAGTIALRELIRQGASFNTTSPFVGELLKEI